MKFEQWLISVGKSPKTARNYAGAISGGLTRWAAEEGLINESLLDITSVDDFKKIAASIRQLAIFGARNTIGKGMYNAALNIYQDYLADTTQDEVETDVDQIMKDESLSDTEKATLVNTRVGHGQFLKQLILMWGGCAVTGYRDSRLLVASHIKPWSKSNNRERLDPFNGLLLLPNLDKVFDLGYISFEISGRIRVSGQLESMESLGIDEKMNANLTLKNQEYLEYHRKNVFKP